VGGASGAGVESRALQLTRADTRCSALYTQTHDKSPVFVKTGLFPPGSVPAPAMELFCRNLEEWEGVHEGAKRLEEQ
jgi:hypothetical protein